MRIARLGDLVPKGAITDGPFGSNLKGDHYVTSGVRVIRLANIGLGAFLDTDHVYVSREHFARLTRHEAEEGDLLVAALGDGARPAGRACLVPAGLGTAIVKADCFRVRLRDCGLDPLFLMHYLNSPGVSSEVAEARRGATRPRLTLGMLAGMRIPLPPLDEQRRIGACLTAQLAAVDHAHARAREALELARQLFSAELHGAMAPGPGWRTARLRDVAEIQLGKMLSPASKLGVRSRPYLRNANVQWGRFALDDVAEMDFDERQERKFQLRAGDVMVCEGGEPGRAAVWDGAMQPMLYQKSLHRLRPLDRQMDPGFLMYRLWLGATRGEFTEEHAKTTIAHLPAVRLGALIVDLPDLTEQRRIAAKLDEHRAAINVVSDAVRVEVDAIEALPAALLRQAFAT